MLATFVIGLREGLEAALIVGMIAAFVGRTGRPGALRPVWAGITLAVGFCIAAAVALQVLAASLPQAQQEGLETVVGVAAVAMVTYMVFWMRRHARDLRRDLELAASSALAEGTAWALVAMAVLAVLREGLETAVFLLAAFNASGSPLAASLGAILGIAVAVAVGYGIYRGGVRLNLARFFRATGLVLVVVAAGLVSASLHTAHEAGWINVGQDQLVDLSWLIQPGSVTSALVTGVLGLQPRPTLVEGAGWLLYVVPMTMLVLLPPRRAVSVALAPSAAMLPILTLVVLTGASGGGPANGTANGATATGGGAAVTVTVTLSNDACVPDRPSVPPGAVTFKIVNQDGDAVSEVELTRSGRILGERENIAPGLSGTFSLVLDPGSYVLACPGAITSSSPFRVETGAKRSP